MRVLLRTCIAFLLLAAPLSTASSAQDQKFSKQQLDQMLAPIALYPDDLLSNILMAATYPLDVVEAERWRSEPANADLQGDALVEALKSKTWDPSIKALIQFPDVLKMMSDQLDWTQNLGDAFLAQQDAVMDEVQFLRSKADASGHLKSNSQQIVDDQDGNYIIRPVNPDTIYVPVYEPAVVYGPWWYPDYPPYYWGWPGAVYTDGFFWGVTGVAIAGGIWGWNHWDWRHRHININENRWNQINGNRNHYRFKNNVWQHNANRRRQIPSGKNFNRAKIEQQLGKTDHPALNNKVNHGAQLRHNARSFNKANGGKANKVIRAKRGAGAPKFVKPHRSQAVRARSHVKKPAIRVHGGRRGGARRRR